MKKELYNEDLKKEYFKTLSNGVYKSVVNRFIRYNKNIELPLNKDLLEMSKEDLLVGLSNMGSTTYSTIRYDLSIIANYIDWAIKNKKMFNTMNTAKLIKPHEVNITHLISTSMYKDPTSLLNEYLSIAPSEGCPAIAIICLIYLGLSDNEIVSLKKEEIDFDNHIIKDKQYFGFDEIFDILKIHNKIESYTYYTPTLKEKIVVRYDTDKFLTKFNCLNSRISPEITKSFISLSTVPIFKLVMNNKGAVTLKDKIALSGKFYSLYVTEKINGHLELNDFIEVLGIDETKKDQSSVKFIINDYAKTYEVYKQVFWG